ncbi:MAG: GNAT family N-acetyltransferase [Spirochaetales bacterium]|nr:GNAT family N-acetyltransferase [Spirochaetales bacterium]
MKTIVKIRVALNKDIPALCRLLEELTKIVDFPYVVSEKNCRKMFYRMKKSKGVYKNLVAVVDNTVAGFLSLVVYKTLLLKGGTALINELVVSREYRRKGIGTLLIKKACMLARESGMDEIEVGTECKNRAAQSFDKKNGFSEEYVLLGKFL